MAAGPHAQPEANQSWCSTPNNTRSCKRKGEPGSRSFMASGVGAAEIRVLYSWLHRRVTKMHVRGVKTPRRTETARVAALSKGVFQVYLEGKFRALSVWPTARTTR